MPKRRHNFPFLTTWRMSFSQGATQAIWKRLRSQPILSSWNEGMGCGLAIVLPLEIHQKLGMKRDWPELCYIKAVLCLSHK